MQKYDLDHIVGLNEYLIQSNVHDAYIEYIDFQESTRELSIKITNLYFSDSYIFSFSGCVFFSYTRGNRHNSYDTINSIYVEQMPSALDKHLQDIISNSPDAICLVFEMISNDSLYVIAEIVTIDNKTGDGLREPF